MTRPEARSTEHRAVPRAEPGVTERWQLAWEQRELLLAMARSRVSWHEAEDVVSEVLLRVRQADDVPTAALRSWLVTTTLRLCTDTQRGWVREGNRNARLAAFTPSSAPSPEDEVVDRAQARWLAGQMHRLPGHQAEAIDLRSQGHEVGSIAGRMGLPYKAVESLLSRARRSLKTWAAAAVGAFALARFLTRRTAQLHVAAAACVTVVNFASPMVGAAVPFADHDGGAHQLAPATTQLAAHDRPGLDAGRLLRA